MFIKIKQIESDNVPDPTGGKFVQFFRYHGNPLDRSDQSGLLSPYIGTELSINPMSIKALVPVAPRYEGSTDREENRRANINCTKILFLDDDEILVAESVIDIERLIKDCY